LTVRWASFSRATASLLSLRANPTSLAAEQSGVLHAITPEPADDVDDDGGAGAELSGRQQLLHSAIGGHAGIGEGTGVNEQADSWPGEDAGQGGGGPMRDRVGP
jgi:hypothetical protein